MHALIGIKSINCDVRATRPYETSQGERYQIGILKLIVISPDTYYFGETRVYLKLYNSCLIGRLRLLSEQKEIQSACKTALQCG